MNAPRYRIKSADIVETCDGWLRCWVPYGSGLQQLQWLRAEWVEVLP